jgi:hypothetical protein
MKKFQLKKEPTKISFPTKRPPNVPVSCSKGKSQSQETQAAACVDTTH